ncbi:MAG: zf-HC2 domain-containing protein [Clostridia bacterium]
MQCNKYRILIHKQLDGRATELEIRQLRQHLDTCPNCSRYQEETTALMESLRLTPLPAPPGLQAASPSGLKSRREPSSRKPSLTTGLLLGSSCIAAGCLVLLSFLGRRFSSLPANIYEHLSLFISNFSVSLESWLSGLWNVWARFPSL